MNAEAVLKQRVRNEQTSGEKKSLSKGVLIFYFFPAQMQIFRPIGQTFGSRRERVNSFTDVLCFHTYVSYPGLSCPQCIRMYNGVYKLNRGLNKP